MSTPASTRAMHVTEKQWEHLVLVSIHTLLRDRNQAKPLKDWSQTLLVQHPDLPAAHETARQLTATLKSTLDFLTQAVAISKEGEQCMAAAMSASMLVVDRVPPSKDACAPTPHCVLSHSTHHLRSVRMLGNEGSAAQCGRSDSTWVVHRDWITFLEALSVVRGMPLQLQAAVARTLLAPQQTTFHQQEAGLALPVEIQELRVAWNEATAYAIEVASERSQLKPLLPFAKPKEKEEEKKTNQEVR